MLTRVRQRHIPRKVSGRKSELVRFIDWVGSSEVSRSGEAVDL